MRHLHLTLKPSHLGTEPQRTNFSFLESLTFCKLTLISVNFRNVPHTVQYLMSNSKTSLILRGL